MMPRVSVIKEDVESDALAALYFVTRAAIQLCRCHDCGGYLSPTTVTQWAWSRHRRPRQTAGLCTACIEAAVNKEEFDARDTKQVEVR